MTKSTLIIWTAFIASTTAHGQTIPKLCEDTADYTLQKDTLVNGRHFNFIDYYPSGELKILGRTKNKKKIGDWIYFYLNGQQLASGQYYKGKKIGKWVYYDTKGIKTEVNWKRSNQPTESFCIGCWPCGGNPPMNILDVVSVKVNGEIHEQHFLNGIPNFTYTGLLQKKVVGALIKFDKLVTIDTLTKADIDSACHCARKKPTVYYFQFTNVGTEPLIVQFTSGSDPDFNCYVPKKPIAPGQRDSIGICVPESRLTLNKFYKINCNSVFPQTINIRRVCICCYD